MTSMSTDELLAYEEHLLATVGLRREDFHELEDLPRLSCAEWHVREEIEELRALRAG